MNPLTQSLCPCRHTKSQLHPDPTIDRVLTVAERKRLQSIPDDVPLKVQIWLYKLHAVVLGPERP